MAEREPQRVRDLISKEGAETLARELTEYWHKQGFSQVQHWVRPMRTGNYRQVLAPEERGNDGIWCVRGNLVRGLPPKPGGAP